MKKKQKKKLKKIKTDIKNTLKGVRGKLRERNELEVMPKPIVHKNKKKETNKKACRNFKKNNTKE